MSAHSSFSVRHAGSMLIRFAMGVALVQPLSALASEGPAPATPASHRVCHDVWVEDAPKDQHRLLGTAIGAVAGGLLGHQIGGGRGNTLATIGGAAAGGYAGHQIQAHQQAKHRHLERRCTDRP